jgi:hypothetical protein
MVVPESERVLAALDSKLNNRRLARIQRVRLLDLWWRIATSGRPEEADLERVEREFLAKLLDGVCKRRTGGARRAIPQHSP